MFTPTLEDRISVAKFMGWYIEIGEIDPKYPNQEWHTTKRLNTEDWGGSQCVFIDSDTVEEDRIKIDNDLWDIICSPIYGRCGKQLSDYNQLMKLIEKIESLDYTSVYMSKTYLGEFYIEIFYDTPSYKSQNKKTILIKDKTLSKEESIYKACIEYIKWYTENALTDKSQLNKY